VHDRKRAALERFVARLTRRSVLNDEEVQALLALPAEMKDVAANRDFVRMEERTTHACLLEDGLTARFGQTASGERQIIMLHIPGDMADLHSVVTPKVTTPLHALTRSTIWRIPHESLKEVASRYPAVAHAFWRDGMVDANIIAQSLLNLGRRPARGRLAHLLCEMRERYREIGVDVTREFAFPATQQQIGDALGLTPVHINRTVRALREAGLVEVSGGVVRIFDWEGLQSAGDFDPAYLTLNLVDFHSPGASRTNISQS
jgi:CRP-like cAMP-binding protein